MSSKTKRAAKELGKLLVPIGEGAAKTPVKKSNLMRNAALLGTAAAGGAGYALLDKDQKEGVELLDEGLKEEPPVTAKEQELVKEEVPGVEEPAAPEKEPPKEEPVALTTKPAADQQEKKEKEPSTPKGEGAGVSVDMKEDLLSITDPVGLAEKYNKITDDYRRTLATAYGTYQETKDRIAAARLWEGIIQGLGYLAAGIIGAKEGLDLSGLKFDETDWNSQLNQNTKELELATRDARDISDQERQAIDKDYDRNLDRLRLNTSLRREAYDKAMDRARQKLDREKFEFQKGQAEAESQRRLKEYNIRVAEAAMKDADAQKQQAGKNLKTLDDRINSLTLKIADAKADRDTRKVDELTDVYKTLATQYQQVAGILGIESVYSPEDVVMEKGFFSDKTALSQEGIRQRVAPSGLSPSEQNIVNSSPLYRDWPKVKQAYLQGDEKAIGIVNRVRERQKKNPDPNVEILLNSLNQ